ncbi:glutaminyl-peptide cyclotransferase-like isoform X2 [Leptopilina heterotoma]|nr:glutaminyl-peptide cyclotransferase-like isoform X2 [Leptopilina heterotoma]XP_043483782.1 glutaminyl-peptide cyclotransferase-like isoform X2 [Leptopilina heterotoma]XP_043483783.1 glutaminyl-peptide cyclotransferase-like isoform X2 [Leptopilina heterotoma]XP_043483784.1 glutaminyl-peptide cyclotransferase-like isoform X2 [Leptopilina heterotoma]
MFVIITFLLISTIWKTGEGKVFKNQKNLHQPGGLNENQINTLAQLSNLTHMDEILDNICVERVVGTEKHEEVKEYIHNSMADLGWSVEIDEFYADTPIFGNLKFSNVIAKLNPHATRYLTLACHYDSKYMFGMKFVGAIDSAVPCAQLINTAKVMNKQLNSVKNQDVSLMFIFFDGEEAFETWGPTDSIYGARHLAKKWSKTPSLQHLGNNISELDKIDLLVLLDLIGDSKSKFRNYSTNKKRWYELLLSAEAYLASLELFENYSYGYQKYFEEYSTPSYIEDDHIPFLKRNVPVLHIIPYTFPEIWHTEDDKRENIDLQATENINKILRLFIASYLHINV